MAAGFDTTGQGVQVLGRVARCIADDAALFFGIESGHAWTGLGMSALCQKQTLAPSHHQLSQARSAPEVAPH